MAIVGLRTTTDFVQDQRPKNWREGIMLLNPNGMTPIVALTSLMKTKVTDDPEFAWWEKQTPSRRFALNATINNSVTAIDLNSLDPDEGTPADSETAVIPKIREQLAPGTLLYVEQTGEIMHVTAWADEDTATVVRGYGGTSAAAVTVGVNNNPNFFSIGNVNEEGSAKPSARGYDLLKVKNFTQIFRDNFSATRTAMATRLRTGDDVREAKRETLLNHSIGIERAIIWGGQLETTLNGEPARTTGGIVSFIPAANVIDNVALNSGDVKMETFEGWMEQIFRFGSQEKMAFCGNRALLALNQAVRKNSSFNIETGIREFGMRVTRMISPFGELVLKTHPLFNQLTSKNVSGDVYWAIDSHMLVVDMAELVYRPLKGGDTHFIGDQEARGDDAKESGYLTECGLETHHGKAHFLIKGMANGIAD